MKITPLEIRQKTFEQKFRGYDKEEVDAFLQALSYEWERIYAEFRDTKNKLELAEKDVQKLREVESSLYKALKTAEDTSHNMVDQASKAAQLHLKEAQMDAEMLLNEAKQQSRNMVEEAEEAVKIAIDNARYEIQKLEQEFKVIENQRENLIHELKNLATDTLDRANRYLERTSKVKFKAPEADAFPDNHLKFSIKEKPLRTDITQLVTEPVVQREPEAELVGEEPVQEIEFEVNTSFPQEDEPEEEQENTFRKEADDENEEQSSFFDRI